VPWSSAKMYFIEKPPVDIRIITVQVPPYYLIATKSTS
jgi:hypothetical protein